ncbi:MAG: glycosyl transferase family 2, partial [Actinomycetota bacterium]
MNRPFATAASAIGAAATALCALPSLYLAATAAVGFTGARRRPRPSNGRRTTRFAVCVPAHDEQAVIERTVSSLLAQDYPRR